MLVRPDRRALVAGARQHRVEPRKRDLDVGDDWQPHHLVLVDLGRVDVDVDNRAVLGEFLDLASHAVVKAHAEREQHVGFVHRVVRVDRAVHAQPLERERMRSPGNEPMPISVVATGICVRSTNSINSGAAPDEMMPPPHVEHRALGAFDQADHLVERDLVRLGC